MKVKDSFDSLSMYHHASDFDLKLKHLLAVLELPKEYNLAKRFKQLESMLDKNFRLELMVHLHLARLHAQEQLQSEPYFKHPEILLHFWCLLECSDSIPYIARYLDLSPEEVEELIRELHHTFSIQSLLARIRQYYQDNKQIREAPKLHKDRELLGIEPSVEPRDTAEDRKQRLRRRYGHLASVFDIMSHTV